MARRAIANTLPSWPASLAFALPILCALILSGSVTTASAKHTPKKAEAEVLQTEGSAPVEPAATSFPAVTPAAKRAAGHTKSGASAGSGAAPKTSSGTTDPPKEQRHATRVAERVARHEAQKAGKEPAVSGSGESSAGATPQAQSDSKSKSRREREREQRRRERERKAEREGRETRKEREAREAREAHEAEEGGSLPTTPETPTATTAANAPLQTPAPTAPAESIIAPPAVVGETASSSSGSPHSRPRPGAGKRIRKGLHGAVAAGGPAATGNVAASAAARQLIAVKRAAVGQHSPKPVKHAGRGSQLVTTVTKIIGVVPTLLWLLVGALGLLAGVFFLSSRLAGRRAGRLERQRQALLEDVGLLQGALLPELPERLGPVATTAAYRPASGPGAGGDFYDVLGLPDGQLAVIVGDVSGHGREALPHTTLLRFTLRAYLEAGLSPREALRQAAPVLERQLGDSFATVVLAIYNPRERTLTYACAGHPHPLLTGLASDAAITACAAPPIGASQRTGTRQTVLEIPGETVACFYTDGVIEARIGEELFGVERLSESLEAIAETATAASLLDRVREEADRHPDDMAACVLRIEGGEARGPVIRSEELELDERELHGRRVRRFLDAAGLDERAAERTLLLAGRVVAEDGSALLKIRLGEGPPAVSITKNNVAPLRARSIVRPQEVAV